MIVFFLFYNKSYGKQRIFCLDKIYKHVECLCFDGDIWVMFQLGKFGITYRRINSNNGVKIVKNLRIISSIVEVIGIEIQDRKSIRWKPFWVRSCNEFCRYLTGIDIGLTFNPRHFYKKLLRYSGKRNYRIIYAWRRKLWDSSEETTKLTIPIP